MTTETRIKKSIIRTPLGYRGMITVYDGARRLWSRQDGSDYCEVQGAMQGAHRLAMDVTVSDVK